MVLQMGKPILVWGKTEQSKMLEVRINKRWICSAEIKKGDFSFFIPPQKAAEDVSLEIDNICLEHIDIGEVWVAGGQSNMEFMLKYAENGEKEIECANDEHLRTYTVGQYSFKGEREAGYKAWNPWEQWFPYIPEYAAELPATAIYFAKKIRKSGIPVGIINCSCGGTSALAWLKKEYLSKDAVLVDFLADFEAMVSKLNLERYYQVKKITRPVIASPQSGKIMSIILKNTFKPEELAQIISEQAGQDQEAYDKKDNADPQGNVDKDFPPISMEEALTNGPGEPNEPGALYENMVKEIVGFSIRGVIWYQGETDEKKAEMYAKLFSALIQCWREEWRKKNDTVEKIPFLFVQLAPFGTWMGNDNKNFPILREQQEQVAKCIPDTYMVCTSDIGNVYDIHPKDKKTVGERLALLADKYVYGRKSIVADAPEMGRMIKNGNLLRIWFKNGQGLYIREEDFSSYNGFSCSEINERLLPPVLDGVNGLKVLVDEKVLVKATCSTEEDWLLISSEDLYKAKEICVEFAQTGFYQVNLYNGAGIPVKPFRRKKIMENMQMQKPEVKQIMFDTYDIDDVDGILYMLDHSFSGCYIVGFSKRMNESVKGTITWNGEELPYVLKSMSAMGNEQMLGIFVRNICTQYGKEYVLHFENFVDIDGNKMEPQDVSFTTLEKAKADPAYEEHDMVALKIAEEGMVLLKNEGKILPLEKNAHFHLVGANDFRIGAVGAGKINPRYCVRLKEAIEESTFCLEEDAEICMIVISRASGENYDNGAFKGQYYLSSEEEKQISEAKEKYKKIIIILNSGYPMDVSWAQDDKIKALIWTGYSGMLGGTALVNILNGTVTPSGKLADTWSNDYYDIPSSKNFYMPETEEDALDADHDIWVNTVYEEDIYVGYRYFETFNKPVSYPFGYGLSYTNFHISARLIDSCNAFASVEIKVKNTGDYSGKEIVQIYVSIPDGKLEQPSKRLVAFGKTKELAPGEEEVLRLEILKDRLLSFDEEISAYVMEAGEYKLMVGTSVKDVDYVGSVSLEERQIEKSVENYMQPPVEFVRLSKRDGQSYPKGKQSGIIPDARELPIRAERRPVLDEMELAEDILDDWSEKELARLSVCASSGWGMQDIGVAGRIYQIEGREIPYFAVADGNNGVNINKKNIGLPTSNLVCSTWNEKLAYEAGRVLAQEAKENNVQMILAPAMNIHRNPLCGRHPEYFSEDPLLAGIMAGSQSKGLEENGVSSSVKHVCCNGSEASRKRNHSIVSQRALREIYLRSFEVAFQIHKPDSIMTAYNACNGVFTAEDEELIQGIMRKEFGFDGFVMTDWNSYDTIDIAKAVQAGNCWMTPGSRDDTFVKPILAGIENGTISESRLRQNCKYLYRILKKYK